MVSIVKLLLLYYLLSYSSVTENLLSKQMKTLIEDNRLIQHLIGLLTMIVLISLLNYDLTNTKIVIYGLITYILFILSTKLDIHWNIIILSLLFVMYLYEHNLNLKQQELSFDKILNNDEKNNIFVILNNKKHMFIGLIGLFLIIGVYLYLNKKDVQYGGGFNWINFLLY